MKRPTDEGDYSVQAGSSLLPGDGPGGVRIGALGEGCSQPTATRKSTWGAIKAGFHR
jgi:hypothetical protein